MLSLFLAPAGANNVLILGDSIAEFSGRSMSEYCAGQSYVNMAVRDAVPREFEPRSGSCFRPHAAPHKAPLAPSRARCCP